CNGCKTEEGLARDWRTLSTNQSIFTTGFLVSFGASRSSVERRTSARRTVSGMPRRTVSLTTVFAPPELTIEFYYTFTTSAFRFWLRDMRILGFRGVYHTIERTTEQGGVVSTGPLSRWTLAGKFRSGSIDP